MPLQGENLTKKDPSKLNPSEHQTLAQKIFADGRTIESVIILHGLIEIGLNRFWMMFQVCNRKKDNDLKPDFKSRSYGDLTKLFADLTLLDKETYQNLNDFNAFRNLLSHNLYGNKKKKITKKETEQKFNQGIIASEMVYVLMVRYLVEESKKNPTAKDLMQKISATSKKNRS